MYFLIPSFSLSLLHSSEELLHSSSSACQTTPTTETHLLHPTLPEQTPVIDLSSPTSLSKWSYYFRESCSTSCCPKIPCLTCSDFFISFQAFSIFLAYTHPTFILKELFVFWRRKDKICGVFCGKPLGVPSHKTLKQTKKKGKKIQTKNKSVLCAGEHRDVSTILMEKE